MTGAGTGRVAGDVGGRTPGRGAIISVRVSTNGQAEPDGYAIPAQRQACTRQTGAADAVVPDELVDRAEPARTVERRKAGPIDDGIVHTVTEVKP